MGIYNQEIATEFLDFVDKEYIRKRDLEVIRSRLLKPESPLYRGFVSEQLESYHGEGGAALAQKQPSFNETHMAGELTALGFLTAGRSGLEIITDLGLIKAIEAYAAGGKEYHAMLAEESRFGDLSKPEIKDRLVKLGLTHADYPPNEHFKCGYTGIFAAAMESAKNNL